MSMNIQAKLAAVALALTVASGTAARAGTVLSDNFNSENGGVSAVNYTGFANWTSGGGVNLLGSSSLCDGGSGSCVELLSGSITSSQAYAVSQGQLVTLTFDIASAPGVISPDYRDFAAQFEFPGSMNVLDFTEAGGWSQPGQDEGLLSSISQGAAVDGGAPWTSYSLSFVAGATGQVEVAFAGVGTDVGPLLDNVDLTITAVPEPAAWAMLVLGVAMSGLVIRRRRAEKGFRPAAT